MIQRTDIEKWILPSLANKNISYTTEYWLGLSSYTLAASFVFQKKRLLIFFKVIEQSINQY